MTDTMRRNLHGTGMPGWLLLGLVALGLPRTILADLGVVAPESSSLYYVLALVPFVVWLAVAVVRRTASPLKDHLVAGALYGLSLVIVHEALWASGASVGHHLTQSALGFGPPLRDIVLHGYAFVIAMTIGVGVGLTAGVVAAAANRIRTVRAR